MDLTHLLQDRLIFVTGKGGTGKTTLAAALARLQAARGRRTLLCEVDAQRAALAPIFGVGKLGLAPVQVARDLHVCNLTWPEVLVSYLESMVRVRKVVEAILANERVQRFLDFTPGSQELVELSVIGDLRERYDVVVVDMPASGHAFSMLDITRSAMGLFRAGPVRRRVEELRAVLRDPTTRTVFVALPEEMVVNETLETLGRMREAGLLGGEPVVVLNRAADRGLTDGERTLLERLSRADLGHAAAEFVAAGRWEASLEEALDAAVARLSRDRGVAPVLISPSRLGGRAADIVRDVSRELGARAGLSEQELSWT